MSTLHLLNKSPARCDALAACVECVAAGDAILLIEDAVYAATAGGFPTLNETPRVTWFALDADLQARGLADRMAAEVAQVDYAGFVELATRHDRVVSWL